MRAFFFRSFCAIGLIVASGHCTASAADKPLAAAGHYFFQQSPVKGRILSADGLPVKFGTVKTSRGVTATTDKDGYFSIDASQGDTITVSGNGLIANRFVLTTLSDLSLVLQRDEAITINKAKAVELIYTTVPPAQALASTGVVNNRDIVKVPVSNFRNALPGRLSGLYVLQSSGEPGNDGASLSLRGQSPLILIDGIPRDVSFLDLEEIESVTTLKDALATAALGVRGSHGALLITTKKGNPAKQEISFSAQSGTQRSLHAPKPLGAYDYARLYNEALVNEGLPEVYSSANLDAFKNHTDPYGFPDVDWQDQVLKKSSRLDRYTLSATGGNAFARYYVTLEHMNQTGLFRTSDSNAYNTSNGFKSYLIRSNVDLTINPKVSGGIYILGRIVDGNQPGFQTQNIFNSFLTTPAVAYPVYNRDNSFGGSNIFPTNILAQNIASGYRTSYQRDMLADVYLKRTLDELTKGLSVRALASLNSTVLENINRSKSFAVFSPSSATTYQQFGTNGTQANGNSIGTQARSNYLELKLDYSRKFNEVHGLNAYMLANQQSFIQGSDLPYIIQGGSGRVAYDFKQKYLAEFVFGYNGSNRYATDGSTNYGFFPAFGLGWNIAEEDFLKSASWLSNLKLFGSYGKTGWDDPGYYTFIQRYFDAATTYFGTGAGGNTSIAEQPLATKHLSWEKAGKLNVGVEAAVLKDRLSFRAEYYNNKYYDLLMQRGRNTAILGNTYPDENIGQNRYKGWDVDINWQEKLGGLTYVISANASVQNSEVLYTDEVFRAYDYMKRTGRRVGQRFGYEAIGLFQNQAEINSSATVQGYNPQPGDIKYKDLNNDGVIDVFDQGAIGREKPLFFYGANFGINWKGFDVSALVQGVKNRDIYLSGNSYFEFQNNGFGQAYEHHLNRWTTATAASATYPRLGIGTNVNNQATSSYWLRSGDYFRLKLIEIGYSIPEKLVQHIKLKSTRIFISGTNLLTHTKLVDMDPEIFDGSYPMQKIVNMGIKIKL